MALTNAARDLIAQALIGEAFTSFANANARIGVGDSSAAFGAAQTDLQASTNKLRKAMEAAYPTRTGNALTFRSIFGTSEGNFAWNEWGVFNAASAGTMLNRIVASLGTKTSAQSWQFTVTVTVVAA
jgi:hypothetical protein